MSRDTPPKVPIGTILKNVKRMMTRPERVYVIYDKERNLITPRSPSYVYSHVENILSENKQSFSTLLDELSPYLTCTQLDSVPWESDNARDAYWNNGYFSFIDARVAYALTVSRRPRTIIEIGSGNSTKFFRKAIDDFNISCAITSIDPKPRANVDDVSDRMIKKNLLDVDTDLFRLLEKNDILFLDGSHLIFNGTDTTQFFLEILPVLKSGVIVHVHDICLPYEYNALFTERCITSSTWSRVRSWIRTNGGRSCPFIIW